MNRINQKMSLSMIVLLIYHPIIPRSYMTKKVIFQCERRPVAECLMFDAFVCIFLRVQWEDVGLLNATVGLKKGINCIRSQSRPIKPVLRSRKLFWRDSSASFVSIDKILTVMLDIPSF